LKVRGDVGERDEEEGCCKLLSDILLQNLQTGEGRWKRKGFTRRKRDERRNEVEGVAFHWGWLLLGKERSGGLDRCRRGGKPDADANLSPRIERGLGCKRRPSREIGQITVDGRQKPYVMILFKSKKKEEGFQRGKKKNGT